MEKSNIKYIIIEENPSQEKLRNILSLYSEIFEDSQTDFFINRVNKKERVLFVLAFENQKNIGFKIGYKYNESTFYSWIGGVLPEYRKKGIAQELIRIQHKWAKEKGFSKIRTKSMNKYKPMIIVNLKNGFNITSVYTNNSNQTKIVFEKNV